jgi:hypothetical protein
MALPKPSLPLLITKPNPGNQSSEVPVMAFRIAALLVISFLAATSVVRSLGQRAEDFAASALTREQWQQRLEDARRQKEKEAADRAISDPTLQRGDIVSTGNGIVVFRPR